MNKIRILIVEDELLIAQSLSRKLERLGYEVLDIISSGEDAIQRTQEIHPDLILMDIVIKGEIDGIEAAEKIYETYQIPIIYLTAYADENTLIRAQKTGAYGYLLKPFQERELHATIKIALSKHQEANKLKQAQIVTQDSSKSSSNLVNYDQVTQLPNRLFLREQFNQILSKFNLQQQSLNIGDSLFIPVIYLDLDRFNRINNTLGHTNGNILLYNIAHRLVNFLGKRGTLTHLNADEFAIILNPIKHQHEGITIAQTILDNLQTPLFLKDNEVCITASLGIAFYPCDGIEIDTLIQQANKAMKYAKHQGGNQLQIYSPTISRESPEQIALETDLHYALERQELELYYQPRINLKTGKIVAAEALLRWHHPQRGMVSPALFIPIAEANGLIEPIGEWILKTACQQIKTWHNTQISYIPIAVNLSSRQFKQPNLCETLLKILSDIELNPVFLELELTESILIKNIDLTIQQLNALKSLGINIAIDDFGTGYSSLSYLQKFPFDILKIDRCFIRDIHKNQKNAAITKALIAMAHQLNLEVIAEGVETQSELEFVSKHQCDEVQGYLFSRPLPVREFEQLLQQGNFIMKKSESESA